MVCSPVSNTLTVSAQSWTGARLYGSSVEYGGGVVSAVRPRSAFPAAEDACPRHAGHGGAAALSGGAMRGTARSAVEESVLGLLPRDLRDVRDMRDEQPVQDQQGWTVFELFELCEAADPAPATAHVDAISIKGGMGPYPWRRPV